jgi:hypothetical protein
MSDKKQTAVEYLQYTYVKTGMLYRTDFKKAKEMEREQIQDAYVTGAYIGRGDSKTYYEETYGGQDESNH